MFEERSFLLRISYLCSILNTYCSTFFKPIQQHFFCLLKNCAYIIIRSLIENNLFRIYQASAKIDYDINSHWSTIKGMVLSSIQIFNYSPIFLFNICIKFIFIIERSTKEHIWNLRDYHWSIKNIMHSLPLIHRSIKLAFILSKYVSKILTVGNKVIDILSI